jgi:hypothetical protein
MLDIIFANRTFDLGDVYGFGGLSNNFTSIATTGNTDVASFYAKYEKATTAAIDKFIDSINKAG